MGATDADVGLTGHVQAACVTVCGCPPIVSMTLRPLVVEFVATAICNVLLPLPADGLGVIHGGLPVTLHTHPGCVVTVTLKLLVSAGT
jgi:hypothetical protein